jgi:hypothetical protein
MCNHHTRQPIPVPTILSTTDLSHASQQFFASPNYHTARHYAMTAIAAFEFGDINRYDMEVILHDLERYLKGAA